MLCEDSSTFILCQQQESGEVMKTILKRTILKTCSQLE